MTTTTEPSAGIQVHHEWGRLVETVIGIARGRVPSRVLSILGNSMTAEAMAFLEAHKGQPTDEAHAELHERATDQIRAATAILERRGIIVHPVLPLDPCEDAYLEGLSDGLTQLFPRDPMLVIGDTFIETEPLTPFRRKERFGIRRALAGRLAASQARVASVPVALPAGENLGWGPGPFLEGGDVMLLGRDIYVGNSGNASNSAGIQWLQAFLGPAYRVHEVPLSPKFLHLDCVLATPRPGLAMVCREGFPCGLPDFLRDWTLIEVSAEDAEAKLACNGLVLDEKTILVAEELPEVAEALSRAGQEVLTTPFDAVYMWGGAFRCWHHPLVRESTLD